MILSKDKFDNMELMPITISTEVAISKPKMTLEEARQALHSIFNPILTAPNYETDTDALAAGLEIDQMYFNTTSSNFRMRTKFDGILTVVTTKD